MTETHRGSQGHPQPNGGFEREDLGSKPIIAFIITVVVVGVFVYYAAWGMFRLMDKQLSKDEQSRSPLVQVQTDTRSVQREQINAFFSGLGRDRTAPDNRRGLYRVRQFIHNHVLKVNGDRATGYAYLEAKPVYNGESYVVAARYNDEYVKRDGRWRFTKMSLRPFFMVPLKEGWAGDDLLKMGR